MSCWLIDNSIARLPSQGHLGLENSRSGLSEEEKTTRSIGFPTVCVFELLMLQVLKSLQDSISADKPLKAKVRSSLAPAMIDPPLCRRSRPKMSSLGLSSRAACWSTVKVWYWNHLFDLISPTVRIAYLEVLVLAAEALALPKTSKDEEVTTSSQTQAAVLSDLLLKVCVADHAKRYDSA